MIPPGGPEPNHPPRPPPMAQTATPQPHPPLTPWTPPWTSTDGSPPTNFAWTATHQSSLGGTVTSWRGYSLNGGPPTIYQLQHQHQPALPPQQPTPPYHAQHPQTGAQACTHQPMNCAVPPHTQTPLLPQLPTQPPTNQGTGWSHPSFKPYNWDTDPWHTPDSGLQPASNHRNNTPNCPPPTTSQHKHITHCRRPASNPANAMRSLPPKQCHHNHHKHDYPQPPRTLTHRHSRRRPIHNKPHTPPQSNKQPSTGMQNNLQSHKTRPRPRTQHLNPTPKTPGPYR